MKKLLLIAALLISGMTASAQITVTVSGDITANTTWTNNNIYLLSGFVYVTNNAELTIQPGTIIKGDKASKGSLIITRGAKIIADGTPSQPIVFTSNEPVGQRTYGDWGGLIILGRSYVNDPAGEKLIEGGVDPVKGLYGGTQPNDNSGVLRYVRVEFPGIAFQPNNEVNGITFGGVGDATVVDYVMVSYAGDDSFEWFGGTVNAKHLYAFRGLDDDFDTDWGFSGKLQFLAVVRDSSVADVSGSNGFESDNDATGTTNTPYTYAKFSNVSIIGPITGSGNGYNSNYKRGAHIRRSSKTSIYNSAIAGYPTGLLIDGANCEGNATADELQVRNSVWAGCNTPLAVASGSTWDIAGWYNTTAYGNAILSNPTDLQLTDAYNYNAPNLLPTSGSPLLSGADFSASNLLDPFFDVVTYRGAFGNSDWLTGWANHDCQNTSYLITGIDELNSKNKPVLYPNPVTSNSQLRFELNNESNLEITIVDIHGRTISALFKGTMDRGVQTFNIDGSNIASGSYTLFIKSDSGQEAIRFIRN